MKKPNGNPDPGPRNWILIGSLVIAFLIAMQGPPSNDSQRNGQRQTQYLTYDEFHRALEEKSVAEATIRGRIVEGRMLDGRWYVVRVPDDTPVGDKIARSGAKVTAVSADEGGPTLMSVLLSWFPMLLLIGVWIYFMRKMQSGRSGVFGFGKSRARLIQPENGRVTFDDVAGVEEAKRDLEEIVDFLRSPQKYIRLGGRIPKGVLLVGPPGTGKTLIARAVAGEANVPFFSISGSDFVEMFVGVGASRVRDMFEQARKHAPCIVFIDEIDAMGRQRGAGLGGGNDEREQTLNQLLVEMDGFSERENIILIGATNRPDVLDKALLRPGRFDRQVVVPNPDVNGREKILKVHLRKLPLSPDVDVRTIARGTPGFSGADLANLANEAALLAASRNLSVVGRREFDEAKDKIMMGAERRTLTMTEDERRLTAYHEAGHAVCALLEPASDPIHKATIVPRGRALGMVIRLPEGDRVSMSIDRLEADLTVAMGGRVAEEMIFGQRKVTTGASGDIKMATDMARKMVTEWGMSDKIGTVRLTENQEEVFLGNAVTRHQNMSNETAKAVDDEIRRIIDEATGRARNLLKTNHDGFVRVAEALMEHETLDGEQIRAAFDGREIPPAQEIAPTPPPAVEEGQKRRAASVPLTPKIKPVID